MQNFYNAQICLKGHIIANCDDDFVEQNFCEECSSKIISSCPECGKPIHGKKVVAISIEAAGRAPKYELPKYCHNCSAAYPWTKSAIEAVAELIRMEQDITNGEKENCITTLPDIICETPYTTLAVTRAKAIASNSGKFIADGIRQFALDFGCELAKKMFGLE